jgi:alkylation response protein AidB-like acyl-CoA dehydrogenase
VNFSYTEEQRMLADTVARWLAGEGERAPGNRDLATGAGDSHAGPGSEGAFWAQRWSGLADLGVLGLNIAEEHGGLGATPVETLIVMQAFGRALFAQPFVTSAVVAPALIGSIGTIAQRSELLPRIAGGSLRVALGALEPGARFDLADTGTTAVREGNTYTLQGDKAVVLYGDSAQLLIVSARTSGERCDQEGITLFLVDATAAGVTIKGFPTLDGQRTAEIRLANVRVPAEAVLGEVGSGYLPLEWAIDRGIAALCAEAVGAMEQLIDLTAEHLRHRKQFGQAIGRFQALQHRVADMRIAVEQARSMALMAAAYADRPERGERRKALSAAKAMIGRSGTLVGQQAVQLHGGMGMTAELAVGRYFKRLTCIDMTWGNTEHHVEFYGDLL